MSEPKGQNENGASEGSFDGGRGPTLPLSNQATNNTATNETNAKQEGPPTKRQKTEEESQFEKCKKEVDVMVKDLERGHYPPFVHNFPDKLKKFPQLAQVPLLGKGRGDDEKLLMSRYPLYYLVVGEADLDTVRMAHQYYPPALECLYEHFNSEEELLSVEPSSVEKHYLLHEACKRSCVESDVVRFLVEQYPQPASTYTNKGRQLPIHCYLSIADQRSRGAVGTQMKATLEALLNAFPSSILSETYDRITDDPNNLTLGTTKTTCLPMALRGTCNNETIEFLMDQTLAAIYANGVSAIPESLTKLSLLPHEIDGRPVKLTPSVVRYVSEMMPRLKTLGYKYKPGCCQSQKLARRLLEGGSCVETLSLGVYSDGEGIESEMLFTFDSFLTTIMTPPPPIGSCSPPSCPGLKKIELYGEADTHGDLYPDRFHDSTFRKVAEWADHSPSRKRTLEAITISGFRLSSGNDLNRFLHGAHQLHSLSLQTLDVMGPNDLRNIPEQQERPVSTIKEVDMSYVRGSPTILQNLLSHVGSMLQLTKLRLTLCPRTYDDDDWDWAGIDGTEPIMNLLMEGALQSLSLSSVTMDFGLFCDALETNTQLCTFYYTEEAKDKTMFVMRVRATLKRTNMTLSDLFVPGINDRRIEYYTMLNGFGRKKISEEAATSVTALIQSLCQVAESKGEPLSHGDLKFKRIRGEEIGLLEGPDDIRKANMYYGLLRISAIGIWARR